MHLPYYEHVETIIRILLSEINKDLRGYKCVSVCGMSPKTSSGRSTSTINSSELNIDTVNMANAGNQPDAG